MSPIFVIGIYTVWHLRVIQTLMVLALFCDQTGILYHLDTSLKYNVGAPAGIRTPDLGVMSAQL